MPEPDPDAVLAPDFIAGLATLPLSELRARRTTAAEVESGLSYVRRLAQGRLDSVGGERQRRSAPGGPAGSEDELADLVARLPEILADHGRPPGSGRRTTVEPPGQIDPRLLERLERVAPADRLERLPELDDKELTGLVGELGSLEHELSGRRRLIHEVLDRLQEETVRRYRTGEADPDSLLG